MPRKRFEQHEFPDRNNGLTRPDEQGLLACLKADGKPEKITFPVPVKITSESCYTFIFYGMS
ncbi:hypothetical protein ATPR_1465 [Acetobacter tropicalis NBRC 101654]|uniref:Uncharacterized protein n=1 Tax=Acetobacter tropicalis NBRC 101654 TaxID=749388 RepID=F7VDL6_9PROT|nr:hypothetical protein ATPR_1465 [Acetobacter tropicalis NBRC 101654]